MNPRDLKIGVLLPLWTGSLAGLTPSLQQVLDSARAATDAERVSVIPHPWNEAGL